MRRWWLSLIAIAGFFIGPANAADEIPFPDITCETTTTTGIGTVNLDGALTGGYLPFATQVTSGNSVFYNIVTGTGASRKVEVGKGVFTDAAPDTLTRVADWSTDGVGAELTLAGTSRVCIDVSGAYFNQGAGSGLNADFLDGISSASFVQTTLTLTGGTGIATIGDLSTNRTIDFAPTELNTLTFGSGTFTALTFDAGATDPTFTFASNSTTVSNSATFSLGTTAAFTTGTIELGAAADTTLSRPAAGRLAVEGVDVPTLAGTGLTATTNTFDCDTPSETAVGCIELATTAEAGAQTDTSRAVTPAGLAFKPESFVVAASDETTVITAATNKVRFRMPYAFTVTGVRCSLNVAQTGGSLFTVDINEAGTTIISTKLTFDNNETTTTTAVTPAVISDSALASDAEMSIDVDTVGTGSPAGLKCTLIGHQ